MERKTLVFDMDGTIADLYQFPNWLEYLTNEDTTPYRNCQPLYDMAKLADILNKLKAFGWQIVVVSWGAMNGTREYTRKVKTAKREWLADYGFPADKIHVVKYGTLKHSVCKKYTDYGILIDDNADVRKTWKLGNTLEPDAYLLQKLEALAA